MIRRAIALGMVGACLAVAVSAQGGKEHSILVTVVDKSSTALRDMKASEFTVQENGDKRQVTNAELATEPITVAILLDTTKPAMGVEYPVRDVRNALTAFAKTIYADNPASKISLTGFGGAAVRTVDYTTDGDRMLAAINKLVAEQSSYGVLVEGVSDTAKDIAKQSSARKAIVIVSFATTDGSNMQPHEAAVEVQRSGAAVWTVEVGDNVPVRDTLLEGLPIPTGGQRLTMVHVAGLGQAMAKIATALTSQYLVTYNRPDGVTVSSIDVKAKRGDKTLRAPVIR